MYKFGENPFDDKPELIKKSKANITVKELSKIIVESDFVMKIIPEHLVALLKLPVKF